MVIDYADENTRSSTNRVFIKCLLANEYAFTVRSSCGLFHVAHHKGMWQILEQDSHWMEYMDDGTVVSHNALLRGLASSFVSVLPSHVMREDRNVCADMIMKVLDFWMGEPTEVTIHQCGRNATIDYKTGKFTFTAT